MIVDATVLLLVVDSTNPFHARGRAWWETTLRGTRPLGLAWSAMTEFLRVSTDASLCLNALDPVDASALVTAWLREETVWVPEPTERHAQALRDLMARHNLCGPDIERAQLATLALTHGVPLCTVDPKFSRFTELPRVNPLRLAQAHW